MSSAVAAANDLCNRVKWAYHFRGEARVPMKPLIKRQPLPYEGRTAPEIEALCSHLKTGVYSVFKHANARLHRFVTNTAPFVLHAIRWLKHNCLGAIQ